MSTVLARNTTHQPEPEDRAPAPGVAPAPVRRAQAPGREEPRPPAHHPTTGRFVTAVAPGVDEGARHRAEIIAPDIEAPLPHPTREVFDAAAAQFEPEELAQLIALLVTINAWNRIGVTTRCWEPGTYQPGA